MSEHDPREAELAALRELAALWKSENLIKTLKLQFLLTVNALLVAAVVINGGWVRANLTLYLCGLVLCVIWLLSIGNTSLHQKLWRAKMERLAAHHADDARFTFAELDSVRTQAPRWLRLVGGVSSKYYLVGAPLVFGVSWLVATLAVLR